MITVLFDCKACGAKMHPVVVPERENEDIVVWLKIIAEKVGAEHRRIAPTCPEQKCDLYIPLPKEGDGAHLKIGQQKS